jgi:hypothetical protein
MYIVEKQKNITKRLVGTHDKPFFSFVPSLNGKLNQYDYLKINI